MNRAKFEFILENKKLQAEGGNFLLRFLSEKKLWEIAAYPLSSPHLVTADAGKKESAFDWRLIKGHSTCAANPLLREHASLISCLEPNNQSICQPARTLTSQTLLPCCGYLPSRGSSNDFVCSKFPFARLVVNCLWIPILPANYSDEHQGGLGRADCPSYTGVATCRNAATAFATSTIDRKPLYLKTSTFTPTISKILAKLGNYFKHFKQRLSKNIAHPCLRSEWDMCVEL